MEIPLYQIDAFASELFKGNPAAICPLDAWLPDKLMQSIAEENNLSETAFFVPKPEGFHIRWFTPKSEVDLCGHATLASAYVLFNILGYGNDRIRFESKSGMLTVTRDKEWITMDFPAQPPVACDIPEEIIKAFHAMPMECLRSEDLIIVFERETDVKQVSPRAVNSHARLSLIGFSYPSKQPNTWKAKSKSKRNRRLGPIQPPALIRGQSKTDIAKLSIKTL